jgi:hypothetical protein
MFSREFFNSDSWRKILIDYFDIAKNPPVFTIHCKDGGSFIVFKMQPWKSGLVIEAYIESGKTSLILLPYEQIKHVEFREEVEGERFSKKDSGFNVPEEG